MSVFTSYNKPRVIDVINTNYLAKVTNLLDAEDPWKDYQQPIYTSGYITAADGKTDLYYRMVKPHDFDPNKKYPTVVYVYGGPHAHNVDASWHYASRSWETYMAQKGYILFILDNRGSENRGLPRTACVVPRCVYVVRMRTTIYIYHRWVFLVGVEVVWLHHSII